MPKKIKKAIKKIAKAVKKEKVEEETIEPIVVPCELVEKVNELETFIAIAEKWGLHRIRQAYHLLEDVKRKIEELKK